LLDHSSVETIEKAPLLFQEGEAALCLPDNQRTLRIIPVLPDGTLKHLAILGPGDYAGEPDFSGRRRHALRAVITDSILQQIPAQTSKLVDTDERPAVSRRRSRP